MRMFFSSALWRVPTTEKKIFLTFDDGPIPDVTPWVLEVLKQYKAKATFFCIGDNIRKHPEIFKLLLADGHSLGNHTFNHLNGWKTNTEEYLNNINLCQNAFELASANFQPTSKLFRPPYGKMKIAQYQKIRKAYSVVMWDVLSGDFDSSISEEKCLENLITKTRAGSVVVFHDSLKAQKNLQYSLTRFVEHFTKLGYSFERLT